MSKKDFSFAIIGNPNNGKSSIISALTMDDRIEISDEMGTTKEAKGYPFIFDDEIICYFYDTPGFEQSDDLWEYFDENKNKNYETVISNWIKDNQGKENYHKDIEVLKIIRKCDYLIFVIDISVNYDENTHDEILEIIKIIDKPKMILFNQVKTENYLQPWKEVLTKFKLLDNYQFNPMDSSRDSIKKMFRRLSVISVDKEIQDELRQLEKRYYTKYQKNVQDSAGLIAESLHEMLKVKKFLKKESYFERAKENFFNKIAEKLSERMGMPNNSEEESYLMKIKKDFTDEVDKKEEYYNEKVEMKWGYKEVKVKNNRPAYHTKESQQAWGMSLMQLTGIGIVGGASAGAAVSLSTGGFDLGLGTAVGALGGGLSTSTGMKFLGKRKLRIDINDYFILLQRALGHVKALIEHGHANREELDIRDMEKFELSKYKKRLVKIHNSFINDKNTADRKEELEKIVKEIIEEQILK